MKFSCSVEYIKLLCLSGEKLGHRLLKVKVRLYLQVFCLSALIRFKIRHFVPRTERDMAKTRNHEHF